MKKNDLSALESRIGHVFSDGALLLSALTHPSYCADHKGEHYQRLEFLGDAVVELTTSRMLYEAFPTIGEGKLTRLRAEMVREESLSAVARELDLGPLIRLSPGEEKSGGAQKPSILCDVMEAVVAAVYLDGGFDVAFDFVKRMLMGHMPTGQKSDALDSKSRLQEVLQSMGASTPEYELVCQSGPAHDPQFEVCVRLDGRILGGGTAHSKRAAQQMAACEALRTLRKADEGAPSERNAETNPRGNA